MDDEEEKKVKAFSRLIIIILSVQWGPGGL